MLFEPGKCPPAVGVEIPFLLSQSNIECFIDERERLTHGTQVTTLWAGANLYHGTVQGIADDQVTLIWHEGSPPSAVNASDIVETWEAVGPGPVSPAPGSPAPVSPVPPEGE